MTRLRVLSTGHMTASIPCHSAHLCLLNPLSTNLEAVAAGISDFLHGLLRHVKQYPARLLPCASTVPVVSGPTPRAVPLICIPLIYIPLVCILRLVCRSLLNTTLRSNDMLPPAYLHGAPLRHAYHMHASGRLQCTAVHLKVCIVLYTTTAHFEGMQLSQRIACHCIKCAVLLMFESLRDSSRKVTYAKVRVRRNPQQTPPRLDTHLA